MAEAEAPKQPVAESTHTEQKVEQKVVEPVRPPFDARPAEKLLETIVAAKGDTAPAFKELLAIVSGGGIAEETIYMGWLQKLKAAPKQADRARDLALALVAREFNGAPLVRVQRMVDLTFSSDAKTATQILLAYFKQYGDKKDDGSVQTALFEINRDNAAVMTELWKNADVQKLSHFDHGRVSQLCEKNKLYQKALENCHVLADITRLVAAHRDTLDQAFLIDYLGAKSKADDLACLRELLLHEQRDKLLKIVVEVASKFHAARAPAVCKLLEETGHPRAVFFFLQPVVEQVTDPDTVLRFIELCVELKQDKDLERACKDNKSYDGTKVKELLISKKVTNPRGLIYCCDRHGFVDELARYLCNNNQFQFLTVYLQKISPQALPDAMAAMLDCKVSAAQIKHVMEPIRLPKEAMDKLTKVLDERSQLPLIKDWLLLCKKEGGAANTAQMTALAKLYMQSDLERFELDGLIREAGYDARELYAYAKQRKRKEVMAGVLAHGGLVARREDPLFEGDLPAEEPKAAAPAADAAKPASEGGGGAAAIVAPKAGSNWKEDEFKGERPASAAPPTL